MTPAENQRAVERLRRLGSIPQFICGEHHLPCIHNDEKLSEVIKTGKFTSFDTARKELGLVPMADSEGTREFVTTNDPHGRYTCTEQRLLTPTIHLLNWGVVWTGGLACLCTCPAGRRVQGTFPMNPGTFSSRREAGDMQPQPSSARRRWVKGLVAAGFSAPLVRPLLAGHPSASDAPVGSREARAAEEPPAGELNRQARCFKVVYDSGPRYVNDHCFIRARDGLYQLFPIVGPAGKGRRVALGSGISDNLVLRPDAGPILIRDRADGFSTTSMESPCVVPKDGRYYLFFKYRNETHFPER
jgi:hypothetical protein